LSLFVNFIIQNSQTEFCLEGCRHSGGQ